MAKKIVVFKTKNGGHFAKIYNSATSATKAVKALSKSGFKAVGSTNSPTRKMV